MKTLIIEDEMMARNSLIKKITDNFSDLEIVGCCGSVKESVEWLSNPANKVDVIFMDVELSDGECFEIFRQVEIKARVIMTTAFNDYAIKAFEVNSVDYLLKPIEEQALRRAVGRCRTTEESINIESILNSLNKPKKYKERYIVKFNDRIVPINTGDIAYLYSEDKCNFVVTSDGSKYIMDQALDSVIKDLDPEIFFRISRGCIVSMKAIESISKKMGSLKIEAIPAPSFEMTVSRSRTDDFLLWIEDNN